MTKLHLVDPDLHALAEAFPADSITRENLGELREVGKAMTVLGDPDAHDVSRSEMFIAGLDGAPEIRLLIYRPKKAEPQAPSILHIHGGGYVVGSADGSDIANIMLASDLGAVIVSVDYRLTPEHPYPAPLDDCYAALAWMHENSADLGIDPMRVAIAGESAGGGLAAGLALRARDAGEYPILFQLLVYPMIDNLTVSTSDHKETRVGEYIWTGTRNIFGWSSYLGGAEPISPAVPARAKTLAGLPPTWIGVGTLDLFLDEDIEYARRLMAENVATELIVYPRAFHGFQFNPDARVSKQYHADIRRVLARAFEDGKT